MRRTLYIQPPECATRNTPKKVVVLTFPSQHPLPHSCLISLSPDLSPPLYFEKDRRASRPVILRHIDPTDCNRASNERTGANELTRSVEVLASRRPKDIVLQGSPDAHCTLMGCDRPLWLVGQKIIGFPARLSFLRSAPPTTSTKRPTFLPTTFSPIQTNTCTLASTHLQPQVLQNHQTSAHPPPNPSLQPICSSKSPSSQFFNILTCLHQRATSTSNPT